MSLRKDLTNDDDGFRSYVYTAAEERFYGLYLQKWLELPFLCGWNGSHSFKTMYIISYNMLYSNTTLYYVKILYYVI